MGEISWQQAQAGGSWVRQPKENDGIGVLRICVFG